MNIRSLLWVLLAAIGLSVGFYVAHAGSAADLLAVSAPQQLIPPNVVNTSSRPMMMLASSKDHTLFYPIYTDYEDIDGDGAIDTVFKPQYKYYGYFDAVKCYAYSTSDGRFNPDSMAIMDGGRYTCDKTKQLWSGNFLNWGTMTRLDTIRKMLYGGRRLIDSVPGLDGTPTLTVLERANLSKDSHSFAKYYNGLDVRDYTPFSTKDLTKTTGTNVNKYAGITICNRSDANTSGGNPVFRMAKGNYRMWAMVEGKEGEVCSWKPENNVAVIGAKLSRYFLDADKGNSGVAHESEMPTVGMDSAEYAGIGPEIYVRVRVCLPSLLGDERCQAFPSTSASNLKPYGIFQEFGLQKELGSAAGAEFGVITGGYDKNLTAGVLRKNMGDFLDEIDIATGVFCHSAGVACSNSTNGGHTIRAGAIKAFDNIQLAGRVGAKDYAGSNFKIPSEHLDGELPAWGNPIGEMVAQALTYFSGSASSNPSVNTVDASLNMPVASWRDPLSMDDAARNNLYGNPICRPMYVMALSSSGLSFDENSQSAFSKLPKKNMSSLSDYVNAIGVNEEVVGAKGLRSVGSVTGGFGQDCTRKQIDNLSDATGVCPEAPAVKGTWQVSGVALYANTSKIRDIGNLKNIPSDYEKQQDILKVKTMAASLQGGVPRVEVLIPNSNPKKYVYITPESLWAVNNKIMPGGILTFQAISSGPAYGAFFVTWNDRLAGGDYDMDLAGYLRYDVIESASGGYDMKISTDVINVGGGLVGVNGFSVMGTDRDGRFLTHRAFAYNINNANAKPNNTPPIPVQAVYEGNPLDEATGNLCKGYPYSSQETIAASQCNVSQNARFVHDKDFLHQETFKMVGVDDVLLKDPLLYAAKYGFVPSSKKDAEDKYVDMTVDEFLGQVKNHPETWDRLNADGTLGADGVPDGYFLARRPELLEAQLRKTLQNIARVSNTAPALSTSVLAEGTLKYAVRFDGAAISGQLEAYKLKPDGQFSDIPSWETGELLQARASRDQGSSREIITNEGAAGVAFRWDALPDAYKVQMTTAGTNKLSASNAQSAVAYIRGDQTQESARGLRERGKNLLGPVVNSTPWLQDRPSAFWGNVSGYGDFYNAHKNRKSLLWVGANDGMLHAFNPDTGAEVFAYVPGALANRLAEIPLQRSVKTSLNGADFVTGTQVQPDGTLWPYVDGNPYSADIKVGSSWRTYVFGALGRGGRGVFALDATSVDGLKEDQASSIFKWQFTSADDGDLGYQTADIKVHLASNQAAPIARLNNGKFAMLIGNGQRSVSGKAVLFILYVDGPDTGGNWTGRYKKIVVDAGSGNGLSTPRWEDIDGNGTADVVYAGDLKGNVWKFDITGDDPGAWKPAFSVEASSATATAAGKEATPLFAATTFEGNQRVPQPITTSPELVYMAQGGVIVTVATGNAFAAGDFGANGTRQSVYGVWDKSAALESPVLMRRSYKRLADGSVVVDVSTASEMDWSKYQGWVMDLPTGGEAVLSDPSYDAGVFSFVSTRPKVELNECNTLPANTLYMLDPISGLPERNTLGTVLVDGMKLQVAGKDIGDPKVRIVSNRRPAPRVACQAGDAGCTCTGTDCSKEAPVCGAGQRSLSAVGRGADAAICYSTAPRLQWREIPGLRTYTP